MPSCSRHCQPASDHSSRVRYPPASMNSRNSALVTLCTSISNAPTSTTVLAELVVPAKRNRGAVGAERRLAGRDRDGRAPWRVAAALVAHAARGAALLCVRQAVPHVEQRLLVHRLVLERREDRLAPPHGAVLAARQVERRRGRARRRWPRPRAGRTPAPRRETARSSLRRCAAPPDRRCRDRCRARTDAPYPHRRPAVRARAATGQ